MRIAPSPHSPPANAPSGPARTPPGSDFTELLAAKARSFLRQTLADEEHLSSLVARRNADLSPRALIELQARVYRYAERVELISRTVDRTASAVKTVLQVQV